MVRIGIAGGYGDVGRTLVEVLSQNPAHDVFIFSRKPIEGVSAIRVEYDNVTKIHDVLEANSIEVVISCLNVMDEKTSQAQVNLAKAAIHSYSTKRFIVSQWSIEIPQSSPLPDFSAVTLAELEAAIGIEYTIVTNGHFSDYYGYPKVKSYLKHADFLVDIRNKTAAIPGSGNDKVVFTYSFDVARFVDALISTSKKWPKRSIIIGDVITMNDLFKLAEEARGEKFVVHCDDSAS
ncbi:hypothetical protein CDV36_002640 [Fusarium kuroshium]|uniref:Uncharacterized protein n=2 Tax=Fusarium solani species complex TaxID=232080 RepID=A0A3M2SJF4_9HYPO|nr:hypothetical protein CDV36_002640 [Fusarium kuroshium]RSL94313.1 hypothetical protein CEP52_012697 [Fusarium oligoseptatum]